MQPTDEKSEPYKGLKIGSGITNDLFRSIDWSAHPLGSPENWSQALKTTLTNLFHSAHPMFIFWGPDLYQFYNDAYLPSFGIGKHPKAMGQGGADCWPEIWSVIKPQIDLVMNGEGSTWSEDQLIPFYRNGQLEDAYWTYGYSPVHTEEGEVGGVLVVTTETTNKVRAVKMLERSREQMDLALRASGVGFWDLDAKTGQIYLSPSLMDEWGIDPETFGNTIEECLPLIHYEDRKFVTKQIQRALQDKLSYDIKYRVVRASGETIWLHAKGRCFLDEFGEPERFTGITTNFTKEKLVAAELEKAKLDAEKANTLKSAFLANMSHEIRTPLGAILGYTELLQDLYPRIEPLNKYLTIVDRNGKSLIRILDDILDLSKIEANKLEIKASPVNIKRLVSDVVEMFEDRAGEKNISIAADLQQLPDFQIYSDPIRVRQILVNLIGNAVKFTEYGGITITGESIEREQGLVEMVFTIKDTGIGLEKSEATRLFKPFTQVENKNNRGFGGTGLGLALSKRLGEALGGDVYLDQFQLGKGCSFKFELKAAKYGDAETTVPSVGLPAVLSRGSSALRGVRVLLVDDAEEIRGLICMLLEREGAEVDCAQDGKQAIDKALGRCHDVVLMDIQMPGVDGFQALGKLQAQGFEKPVLALTAHAMKEDRVRALEAGFSDHVTKPVDMSVLVRKILGVCVGRSNP